MRFDTTEPQKGHRNTESSRREFLCASVEFCALCGVNERFAKVLE